MRLYLRTEIDFLLLKELIAKKALFLDRNADKRIAFSEKPLPLSFEWVYEEEHQGYVFKELIEPPFLLVKFSTPMVFDVSKGRNNVFDTICLFINMVKVKNNGYLGLLSLSGRNVNLLEIVKE